MTVQTRTKRDWESVFSAWSKPPGKTGLPALTGRPLGEACEAVALALAPADGDADAIRIALQEALRAAFAGILRAMLRCALRRAENPEACRRAGS